MDAPLAVNIAELPAQTLELEDATIGLAITEMVCVTGVLVPEVFAEINVTE